MQNISSGPELTSHSNRRNYSISSKNENQKNWIKIAKPVENSMQILWSGIKFNANYFEARCPTWRNDSEITRRRSNISFIVRR